jgi:hypothetical protein
LPIETFIILKMHNFSWGDEYAFNKYTKRWAAVAAEHCKEVTEKPSEFLRNTE